MSPKTLQVLFWVSFGFVWLFALGGADYQLTGMAEIVNIVFGAIAVQRLAKTS